MIDSRGLFDALTTFAATSGQFDSVTGHEPNSSPSQTGVSCSVWFSALTNALSGLSGLSIRVEFQVRIYASVLKSDGDSIDPRVMDAADAFMTSLVGSFTLAGKARYVDLLGSEGEGLRAIAGYIEQNDAKFRVIDIMVPIIINDAYTEIA